MIDVEQRPALLEHDGAASLTRAGQEGDTSVTHGAMRCQALSQVIEHLADPSSIRRSGGCGRRRCAARRRRAPAGFARSPTLMPRRAIIFVCRTDAARGRANTPFAATRFGSADRAHGDAAGSVGPCR